MKKTTALKSPPPAVTPEERYHMINDAAYFRRLNHRREGGTPEEQAGSWCEVESEIDSVLKKHRAAD